MEVNDNQYENVEIMLNEIGCNHLLGDFKEQRITDQIYLNLKMDELKDFVKTVGERKSIYDYITATNTVKNNFVVTLSDENDVITLSQVIEDEMNTSIGSNNDLDVSTVIVEKNKFPFNYECFGQRKPFSRDYKLPTFSDTTKQILKNNTRLNKDIKTAVANELYSQLHEIYRWKAPAFNLNLVCYEFVRNYEHLCDKTHNGYGELLQCVKHRYRYFREKNPHLNPKPDVIKINKEDHQMVLPKETIDQSQQTTQSTENENGIPSTCPAVIVTSNVSTKRKSNRNKTTQLKRIKCIPELLSQFPLLRTESGLLEEIQREFLSKYKTYYKDDENEYFKDFISGGIILYNRLKSSKEIREIVKNFRLFVDDDSLNDVSKTIMALIAIEDYFNQEVIVEKSTYENDPNTKFALIPKSWSKFWQLKWNNPKMLESIKADVYFDKSFFAEMDLPKGYFYVFISFYAFSVLYDKSIEKILICIQKFIMNWDDKEVIPKDVLTLKNILKY